MILALHELKSIMKDRRYVLTVLFTLLLTLAMTQLLLGAVGNLKKGDLLSSGPSVIKLVKIAVVGNHPSVDELERNSAVYLIRTDYDSAMGMLNGGEVHGVYVVNDSGGKFVGSKAEISNFAELSVREALDNVFRKDVKNRYDFAEDAGMELLVKSLLLPILLISPLFILCHPIIQSVAYDRENKMLEVLFVTPIDRKEILISKILANFLFVAIVGAFWVAVLQSTGFAFVSPAGVYAVFLAVALLIISLNAFSSAVTSSVQEATLAASIASQAVFTFIFVVVIFKVFPYTERLSELSPATYIARQAGEAAAFPFNQVLALLIVSAAAILLAVSAFSAEAFAFSSRPGPLQLYEGMMEILRDKKAAAVAMGFVAFSLTAPVQLILLGLLFFLSRFNISFAIILLVAIEEILKGTGIVLLKPESITEGLFYGIIVGTTWARGKHPARPCARGVRRNQDNSHCRPRDFKRSRGRRRFTEQSFSGNGRGCPAAFNLQPLPDMGCSDLEVKHMELKREIGIW